MEPVRKSSTTHKNDAIRLGDGKVMDHSGRSRIKDMEDDQHGSVRSIRVGINNDVADIGNEVHGSLVGGSSKGDLEYFRDCDITTHSGPKHSDDVLDKNSINKFSKII